jgi:hypothetical protein
MRTIHKFDLKLIDNQTIETHVGAVPIFVGHQLRAEGVQAPFKQLCVWAEVDTNMDISAKALQIQIVGTGNPRPVVPAVHIGSVFDGPYVWHIYHVI